GTGESTSQAAGARRRQAVSSRGSRLQLATRYAPGGGAARQVAIPGGMERRTPGTRGTLHRSVQGPAQRAPAGGRSAQRADLPSVYPASRASRCTARVPAVTRDRFNDLLPRGPAHAAVLRAPAEDPAPRDRARHGRSNLAADLSGTHRCATGRGDRSGARVLPVSRLKVGGK